MSSRLAVFLLGCGGLFGFGLGGNLDFFTSLDLIAILDTIGTLDVLDRHARLLGNLGQRLALLDGHLAGLLGFGRFLAVMALGRCVLVATVLLAAPALIGLLLTALAVVFVGILGIA